MPGTRRSFWEEKLKGNVARDGRNGDALRSLGWRVLTVWECELADEGHVAQRLSRGLAKGHRA